MSVFGRNRNAGFGTRTTFAAREMMILTAAVRLGRNLRSGFSTRIHTGYVTTLFWFVAFSRTASTVPRNCCWPYASTWKVTSIPARMRPMSASSTPAVSRSCCNGVESTKKFGVVMLACTVWPRSTRRSTTTPSIGDLIVV